MNAAANTPNQDVVSGHEAKLSALNPGRASRFQDDSIGPMFARLRREDPVHFTPDSEYGPYWSVTRWDDIVTVDTDYETFSSTQGVALMDQAMLQAQLAALGEQPKSAPNLTTMDEPEHGAHRKVLHPTFAPANLAKMSELVRERAGRILDDLPIGEEFDWVERVSKELTAMTLATLLGFPFAQRLKLPYWSDVFVNMPGHGPVKSWEQKTEAAHECYTAFQALWDERIDGPPGFDLISMLAHNPATRAMPMAQYHSTVIVLTIAGNDTTRNTISGSVYALNKFPDQYAKLRANPELVPSMVSEALRWQSPVAHMSRVATRDVVLGGKLIRRGERVVMWYASGNRDEARIPDADLFVIDRPRAREHMAFGFGIHRCIGNRVAELQITIIWEEILKRFSEVKVVSEPTRTYSAFVRGIETLPVVIPSRC